MTEYEKLKKTQIKLGSALACNFKKNGEMLIYVSGTADDDAVLESLIQLATEISKYRNKSNTQGDK